MQRLGLEDRQSLSTFIMQCVKAEMGVTMCPGLVAGVVVSPGGS